MDISCGEKNCIVREPQIFFGMTFVGSFVTGLNILKLFSKSTEVSLRMQNSQQK